MIHIDPIANLLGSWASEYNTLSIIFRIVLSIIFSAIIGFERAAKRHAAGLRTFILISFASTLAMMIDASLLDAHNSSLYLFSAATIVGTAIISSNSVLYSSKSQIKGLTTSAGLWANGIIGLTIGAGMYTASIAGFAALLCCLSLFPPFEKFLKNHSNHFEIYLELRNKTSLADFTSTIRKLGLQVDDIESNPAYAQTGLSVYSISLTINNAELKKYKTHREIIDALRTLEYVNYIEELT